MMTAAEQYAAGRRDAETCEIDPEVRLIHNTTGMAGERLRGFKDVVNERRAAKGLPEYH